GARVPLPSAPTPEPSAPSSRIATEPLWLVGQRQPVDHAFDARPGAGLVAGRPWRSADADGADDAAPGLDDALAADRRDALHARQAGGGGAGSGLRGELGRRDAERERGERFALADRDGVRPGERVSQEDLRPAAAIHHGDGDLSVLSAARLERIPGDLAGQLERELPELQEAAALVLGESAARDHERQRERGEGEDLSGGRF